MHPVLRVEELLVRIFGDPALGPQPIANPTLASPITTDSLRRRPLLSLALTCKTFSDPALRTLWAHIDGIDQLLRTMSAEVIKVADPSQPTEGRDEKASAWDPEWDELSEDEWESQSFFSFRNKMKQPPTQRYMIFKKSPLEQDWEPFDRYANLVRIFRNRNADASGDQLKLARNVYEALRAHHLSRGMSLLPNLQSLTCTGRQLRYATLFLGPHLHTLSIPQSFFYNGRSYEQDIQAFLEAVTPASLPALRTLNLEYLASPHLAKVFAKLVIDCHKQGHGLEVVRAHPEHGLSLEAMRVLLTEKGVWEVDVKVQQFDLDEVFDEEVPQPRKDLRKLKIYSLRPAKDIGNGMRLETCFFKELLQRLRAPRLADFAFSGGPFHLSAGDVRDLFLLLQQGNAYAVESSDISRPTISISPVEKSGYGTVTIQPARHVCTFLNAFYPLCEPISPTNATSRFSHLRILNLQRVLVDLTDDDLGILSRSLPRLSIFTVASASEGRPGQSRTTLVGLWLVAKNCAFIESVSIWLNAVFDWGHFAVTTGIMVPGDSAGLQSLLNEARNTNLTTLMVGDSDIGDSSTVINFIESVYPRIVNLNYQNSRNPDRKEELWREVRFALSSRRH